MNQNMTNREMPNKPSFQRKRESSLLIRLGSRLRGSDEAKLVPCFFCSLCVLGG